MQIDDRPGTEVQPDRNRRRGPLVGIAAAAVILLAGLVFVLARDNTPVAAPAPNATPISADPNIDAPPLAPGAYFVDTDGDEASTLRGTFVIEGSGWTALPSGVMKTFGEDYVLLLVVEVDEVWSPACESPAPAPVVAGSTASDLANQIAGNGFTVREALAPVSAFGHEGHHLVREVPESCSGPAFMAWAGPVFDGGRYYQADGQVVEDWFLDVEGTPVMVEASWFPESPEEDVTELRAVLDTLVITP